MAAVRADVQVPLELVVAVVRAALRAGVGMRPPARLRLGQVLVLDRDVDPAGHGQRDLRPPSPGAGYSPRAAEKPGDRLDVGGVGPRPVTPAPRTSERRATSRSSASARASGSPSGLRHEHRDLVRVEHVDVDRDVDAVGAVERAARRRPRPCGARSRAMNASSGGSRLRAPTSATSSRRRPRRRRSAMRSGMPHSLPDGELSGVFRSPCASSQTTREPAVPRRRGPRPRRRGRSSSRRGRAAAPGRSAASAKRLLGERALSTTAASG